MSELSQKNNLCLLAPIYMGFLISILYPYKVKSERMHYVAMVAWNDSRQAENLKMHYLRAG